MNGKGSKSRVTSPRQFRENYDGINWGRVRFIIPEPKKITWPETAFRNWNEFVNPILREIETKI